jgi:hypothetical protein
MVCRGKDEGPPVQWRWLSYLGLQGFAAWPFILLRDALQESIPAVKDLMKLLDLGHFRQFVDDRSVKVLRHKDTQLDLWALRRNGGFDEYQNAQSWDVIGSASHVIAFIAERYRDAKFVGVWEVLSKKQLKPKGYRYKMKELAGFESLERRLVVRWGAGTRSWAQWLHREGNKTVVEVLPQNYVMEFPGFYDFTLSFDQLAEMIDHPDSNREWQRMLSSISGVYVVLDQHTGKHYIGSAYGSGGIWGRWVGYRKSRSGGNVLLEELLRKNPQHHKRFQFSILRVLEPSATKDEVIREEVLTKKKLGSRDFGLNDN